MLLANGAEVNTKENDGRTALMMVSQNARPEVVQALIAKGAVVNFEENDGRTALKRASLYDRLAVVQASLVKGLKSISLQKRRDSTDDSLPKRTP